MLETQDQKPEAQDQNPIRQNEWQTREWQTKSERYANALFETCLRYQLEPQHEASHEPGKTIHYVSVACDALTWARCLSAAMRLCAAQSRSYREGLSC